MIRRLNQYHWLIVFIAWISWQLPASASQTTERISITSSGGETAAGGVRVCTNRCTMVYFHNQWPSVSADGRYIVFYSAATNLVSGDNNTYTDIFLRDRQNSTTSVLTPGSNGNSSLPFISQSGTYISFRSEASGLISSDTNGKGDVFIFNTENGQTERVSVSSNGWQANGESYNSVVTPDGRFVAFDSSASNLVNGDTNNTYDIFLRDRALGITERITANGAEANGPSFDPVISSDGRFIAFYSFASNLVNNDTNSGSDIFVYDRQTKTFELVSVNDQSTVGNADSVMPSMNDNGRTISFRSLASNLVSNDTNHTFDIFVRDLETNHTQRVNVSSNGTQATGPSIFNAISNDGTRVVFDSYSNNLVPGDTNRNADIFMHDLSKGETQRVSISSSGTEANKSSNLPIISGNGRYVAFESFASNLVSSDNNGNKDIFVRDLGPRNRPPEADAGEDTVFECTGPSTHVTLNGSQSKDPDNNPLQFTWRGFFGTATNATHEFYMGLGTERFDLTVNDDQGATDSDSVYLSVTDSTPPNITMPNSIELEAESSAGTHYEVEPSYQEHCDTTSVNVSPYLSIYPLGKTIVDIEVTDAGNNTSHHSLAISVLDTTAPSVTAPSNISTEATGPLTNIDIGQAKAWDSVGIKQLSNNGLARYPLGITTVTWHAIDAAGNIATATQKVAIGDSMPPTLVAPSNISAEATGILTTLNLGMAEAKDLVDGTILASNNAPNLGFPLGLTTITWQASDLSGNTIEAQQQVSIVDTTP
ncbi:HYR domain-containing protein, partial [Pseudomonadota bacterium]